MPSLLSFLSGADGRYTFLLPGWAFFTSKLHLKTSPTGSEVYEYVPLGSQAVTPPRSTLTNAHLADSEHNTDRTPAKMESRGGTVEVVVELASRLWSTLWSLVVTLDPCCCCCSSSHSTYLSLLLTFYGYNKNVFISSILYTSVIGV